MRNKFDLFVFLHVNISESKHLSYGVNSLYTCIKLVISHSLSPQGVNSSAADVTIFTEIGETIKK